MSDMRDLIDSLIAQGVIVSDSGSWLNPPEHDGQA